MKYKNFKDFVVNQSEKRQNEIVDFIEKYKPLMSEGDTSNFGLTEKPMNLKEALTTKDASVLMTKIMEGTMEEAAEPLYIGSKLFDKIQIDNSNRIMFPAIGALRAFPVAEGGNYREQTLDILKKERMTEVNVQKYGLMVPITEEMIEDAQWQVVGQHLKASGRAMARLKEELIFKAMTKHGHTVFDNDIRDKYPKAGTSGLDEMGQPNDTLAVEDFFDLVVMLMNNGYVPTDALIHPLTWTVFAKNGLLDMFSNAALGGNSSNELEGKIDTDATNGRLPVSMNIMASPFIPFDMEERTFDMYVVDRNNVGVVLQRDEMTTDQFEDPYRDIQNLKVKERYGIGIAS